mmetsp:Transcript_9813/g.30285  ORF Transcript_9813/g.30285 Transcript_9813/m.30285 type:complete len:195 (-) Transcript_9813:328-912(-)
MAGWQGQVAQSSIGTGPLRDGGQWKLFSEHGKEDENKFAWRSIVCDTAEDMAIPTEWPPGCHSMQRAGRSSRKEHGVGRRMETRAPIVDLELHHVPMRRGASCTHEAAVDVSLAVWLPATPTWVLTRVIQRNFGGLIAASDATKDLVPSTSASIWAVAEPMSDRESVVAILLAERREAAGDKPPCLRRRLTFTA